MKRAIWYTRGRIKIELTNAEYDELKALHKKTKDGRECDKIKAIAMLSEGYSIN